MTEFSCASCQSTNLAVNPTEGVYRCANCGVAGKLPPVAAEIDNMQVGSHPETEGSHTETEALVSTDRQLAELGEAARRAGTIVTEYIDSIVASAELRADEIRQAGQRDKQAGERDAERVRREAFDSASRVFDRIQALERPLGELVHTLRVEMDRVGHELEGGAYEEKPAISAEANSGSLPVEEPAVEEVEEVHDAEEVHDVEEVHEAEEVEEAEAPAEPAQPKMVIPGPPGEPQQKEKKPKRRMFRRKGSTAKGAFITTQGHCAVCQRTFMAGSEEAFKLSGWLANGEVGLCPDCQAESWQLPDGARLPFRRGGEPPPSG